MEQGYIMAETNPGSIMRKQLDAASEMGLTSEDVRRLLKRFPQRYKNLAVALGVTS